MNKKYSLVYAPNPIYKLKSKEIEVIDDEVKHLAHTMLEIMYDQHGIGLAAPMVGVLLQVIVMDFQENNVKNPLIMVNPKIIDHSVEKISHNEGSLTFLGVEVEITRAQKITVEYQNLNGDLLKLEASGLLAICIQHEIDYLIGKNILDYVSPIKRESLTRKMEKLKRNHNVHVHSSSCHH